MKKSLEYITSDSKLLFLNCLFVTAIVTSNLIASKVVNTGFYFNNEPITIPSVAINFCFAFLCTDVIGEIYGRKEANKTVKYGFICQLVMLLCLTISILLPAYDKEFGELYAKVLGQSKWFVIGSLVAYLCSQSWDVFIFHYIRKKFNANQKYKWVWNNISTLTSQIIDTTIFITISFGIGLNWLSEGKITLLANMIIGQYLLKAIIAILDTPIFYLLTKKTYVLH